MNGCHNREPFAQSMTVRDGLGEDGMPFFVSIDHTMSRDCRHPERATDPRCAGCKWVTMTDAEVKAHLSSRTKQMIDREQP